MGVRQAGLRAENKALKKQVKAVRKVIKEFDRAHYLIDYHGGEVVDRFTNALEGKSA